MLKDIIMVQPYLSAYYETTKLIVEKQPRQYQNNATELVNDDDDINSNAKF
jgi:hypothetical protein